MNREFRDTPIQRGQAFLRACRHAGVPSRYRCGIPVGAGKMTGRALVGSDAAIIDQLTKEGGP